MLPLLLLACASGPAATPGDTAAPPEEICDGLDNDENRQIDEGFDVDGDGVASCAGDCDDADPAVNPRAEDACDGLDNDCSGAADEPWDDDGDGDSECGLDCADADPAVGGHLPEICDGIDNDCDGLLDEGFDADADGYATCRGDCDDADPATWPGAPEVCDGATNDCLGEPVDETADTDIDGFTPCDGDCDDAAVAAHPGATEVCDGLDNDCDGATDEDVACYGCTASGNYLLCTTALTWEAADAACAAMGAHLASIADSGENAALTALIGGYSPWMGMNDLASEGSWAWSDGSAVTYTSWAGGEPNDSGGEDCAQIYTGNGLWNDLPCGIVQAFVCEL